VTTSRSRTQENAAAVGIRAKVVLAEIAHRKAAVAYAKVANLSPGDSASWRRRARELRHAAIALVEAMMQTGTVECARCGQDTTAARLPRGATGPLCPSCAAATQPAPAKRRFVIIQHDRRDGGRTTVCVKGKPRWRPRKR
jgi:hypothetical protein